jgi:hypothetical protein
MALMRKPKDIVARSKSDRLKIAMDLWVQDPGSDKVDLIGLDSMYKLLKNGVLELKINLRYSDQDLIRTIKPILSLMREYYVRETGKELPDISFTRKKSPRGFNPKDLYCLCVAQSKIIYHRKNSGMSYEKIAREFSLRPWTEWLTPKAADYLFEPKNVERLYKKAAHHDITPNDAVLTVIRFLLAGLNPSVSDFQKVLSMIEENARDADEPHRSRALQALEELRMELKTAKEAKDPFAK